MLKLGTFKATERLITRAGIIDKGTLLKVRKVDNRKGTGSLIGFTPLHVVHNLTRTQLRSLELVAAECTVEVMSAVKEEIMKTEVAMPVAHRSPGIALRSHETGPTYYSKCSCGASFEFESRAQVVVALNAHCKEVN